MRSRFAIASLPKTRVRAFGLALIALSSCALAPRAEAHWRKSHLTEEIASASAFTQIVEERVGGQVAKSYVYGPQRISMRDAGGLHYYGYDAHSGVRVLLDASGAVTDTYEYDAFGSLLARAGTTANDFAYRGEQSDSALGLQYLRARWMNPGTGRFLGRDRRLGKAYSPTTENLYLYGNASPVDLMDPSGFEGEGGLTGLAAAGSIVSNLASMSLNALRPLALAVQGGLASGLGLKLTRLNIQPSLVLEAVEAQIVEQEAAEILGSGVLPRSLNTVQFASGYVREQLLQVAQSAQVKSLVNELYRPGAIVGDGGTADLVRRRLMEGVIEGHFEKGVFYLTRMNRLLQQGSLSEQDTLMVQVLYADMWDACRAVSVVAGNSLTFLFEP